jgi:hypothetical protein
VLAAPAGLAVGILEALVEEAPVAREALGEKLAGGVLPRVEGLVPGGLERHVLNPRPTAVRRRELDGAVPSPSLGMSIEGDRLWVGLSRAPEGSSAGQDDRSQASRQIHVFHGHLHRRAVIAPPAPILHNL